MCNDLGSLVTKAREGDPQAFARLVAGYDRPARRVAWQILGNLLDAEDAVQEAWMVAWHRLASLRDPGRFEPWIYRIVANAALRRRQQRAAASVRLDAYRRMTVDCTMDMPGEVASQGEDQAPSACADLVPAALEILSGKDRLAVTMHYFCGMSIERAADLLDVPTGTVKSRLFHARKTIRKEIESMLTEDQTMAGNAGRPQHIPADFRNVIHSTDRGAMPWHPLLTEGLEGWYVSALPVTWQPISTDAPPTPWQRVRDGLVGEDLDDSNGSGLVVGDAGWANYEVSLLATALAGGNIQLLFRANRSPFQAYVFDMMLGWQTVDIHKLEVGITGQPHLTLLSVVDYPIEHQREYAISIAARGQSLTTYIDGALVNQVTDASIPAGGVGPNVWHGKTLFRDLKIRHMP